MTEADAPKTLDISALEERLRGFAAARDWEKFHTPKNLAMALVAEGGELLEVFQWLTEEEAMALEENDLARVSEELADIQIYLVRLADVLDISIPYAIEAKLTRNAEKYPVDLSKGNATKYSRRGDT
jgi:NTP pyrophosphatase (non-canonical NTP hydrolase)